MNSNKIPPAMVFFLLGIPYYALMFAIGYFQSSCEHNPFTGEEQRVSLNLREEIAAAQSLNNGKSRLWNLALSAGHKGYPEAVSNIGNRAGPGF